MIFETERLFIRNLEAGDSESMFEIYSDKEAMKFRANQPFDTLSEAIEMIKQSNIDSELGLKYRFAIVKKETDELIGTILYFLEDKNSEICNIGYSLGRQYCKQGFALETLNGFMDYLKNLGIKEFHAKVFKMNTDSIHLLNKVAFTLVDAKNDEKLFTFIKKI
ncbi:GNAT family N-acetyltransferase [Flavobacterium sp.]|jgi:RimJ/RimL family protein N-acetyltransferase|uniref:GNAT family N-acetyltransferase n=1 Tax=Flavobacterium sp. TaxID=239 RepID=UPI0037C0EBF4